MTKITTGLATVGLATLALGVAAPAAATAAPSTSDRAAPAVGTDQSPAAALASPKIAFIQPQEIGTKLYAAGLAPGADFVGIEVMGAPPRGLVPVWNDRFTTTFEAEDVGKKAILKAMTHKGGIETVEFVVEPMYAEGEDEAPPTPVIHAVSSYDDEHLVIEGTVAHRPDLFNGTDVWADGNGFVWDFTAENGAFSLEVPVARAGQMIGVTAYYGSHASETVEVELVPTERNTASDVHPLEVASPAAGDVLATPEATFAGSGIPNSQIVVTRDEKTNRASSTLCETRVTSQGDWSCTSPTLPAGSYDTVVTETPTWATAPKQTAGTAFSVADTAPDPGSETSDGPSTPILSSVTEGPDGRLTVRTIIHGAEHARIDVGEHSETRLRGQHGRFSFVVDGSMAGQTATITGLWRGSEGDSLDIDLTPIEAPAGSPLSAPLTHGVLEESNTFYVQGTTSYFADEYLVPTVIAQIDGEFVAATESTWNGAYILRLPASFAGQDVDLYTVRNDELSEATTITVGATEKNSAPETFPLEVTSIAEGETISTDRTSISGEGIPGSRITIATDLARAGEVCAADVLGEGTWTCELEAPLTTGQQTMTVTETPYWRTLAPLTSTRSFTVSDDSDDEDLTDLTVTSHTDGGRYSTGIATFAGRGTPDARLTAANQWGTPMGSTRVDEDGDWSFSRNLGPTSAGYDITFTMTPTTGAPTQLTLHLDYQAPTQPLAITSHVDGQTYHEGIARFTGTGTVGAQLVSTNQWGTQMGKTTIGSDGTWAFTRNLGPTNPGYVLTFTATHGTDIQKETLTLTHHKGDLVDVTISSPVIRDGGITEAHRTLTFRGTATPHATITGKNQWGTPFGTTTATATATGAFAFDRYIGPAGTTYQLTFEQTAPDGTTKTTTGIDFVTGH